MFTETQQHIYECSEIRKKVDYLNFSELKYEMIFGPLKSQERFTKAYHVLLQARDDLLKNPSPAT